MGGAGVGRSSLKGESEKKNKKEENRPGYTDVILSNHNNSVNHESLMAGKLAPREDWARDFG